MVVNEGIGGNITAHMLARFGTDAVDQEPDVVIIWGGINDVLFHGTPGSSIEANLQAMYTQAHNAGITEWPFTFRLSKAIHYGLPASRLL